MRFRTKGEETCCEANEGDSSKRPSGRGKKKEKERRKRDVRAKWRGLPRNRQRRCGRL